ncbi:MAG: universal stress protein [Capsulimonadaceae bacterium]
MFKKLLVPTDGSVTSLCAAETIARTVEGDPDVTVTVVLAIAPLRVEDTDYDPDIVERHNNAMRERAACTLRTTARVFERRSIQVKTKIIEGDPVSLALSTEANEQKYDIIAMGSRGMGMLKSDLHYLGSVTEHVIRRVGIPVLVIPTHTRT